MLIIKSNNTNPFFNIAAEEYLLKNFSDNCFMLYQNTSSVIVGKHQNTLAEINYKFVKENNIPVIRRLSGGGTVYHDLGNLNFTFIRNSGQDKNLVDFKKFTDPIINVLNKMGVDAKFEGHNDIRVNGLKISGNAEHVFKKRVLHHGTLLFSADLNILNESIKVVANKFKDRAVKSVRSNVANIKDYLKSEINIEDFKSKITDYIQSKNNDNAVYLFTENDIAKINELILTKYNTWDWNFGYSPVYNLHHIIKTDNGDVELALMVEKGIIVSLKIIGIKENSIIEKHLTGIKHNESAVRETLIGIIESKKIFIDSNLIIQGLF